MTTQPSSSSSGQGDPTTEHDPPVTDSGIQLGERSAFSADSLSLAGASNPAMPPGLKLQSMRLIAMCWWLLLAINVTVMAGLVLRFSSFDELSYTLMASTSSAPFQGSARLWMTGILLGRLLLNYLCFTWVAVLVHTYRSRDPFALLASPFFLCCAVHPTSVLFLRKSLLAAERGRIWGALGLIVAVLLLGLGSWMWSVVPDGRLERWWQIPQIVLFWMLGVLLCWQLWSYQAFPKLPLLGMLFLLGSMCYTGWLRYQREQSKRKRLQLRWCVLGAMWIFCAQILAILLHVLGRSYMPGGVVDFFYQALSQLLLLLGYLMMLVGISVALARYRLKDFEFALNRSLVYGIQLVLLLFIFVSITVSSRPLFLRWFGGEQGAFALLVAVAVAAGSFRPVSRWLRHFVDEAFFGIRVDYDAVVREERGWLRVPVTPQPATDSFGGYRDVCLIGKGGMGRVFRAFDPELQRLVALKVLSSLDEGADKYEQRLHREAKVLSQLDHPHIVTCHRLEIYQERPVLVLDYLPGVDLDIWLKQHGPLSLEVWLRLLQQLAEALDYAHEQGIVHRDLKPANIMLSWPEDMPRTPDSATPMLMDFGIARIVTSETRLTKESELLGSVAYTAPEQLEGASTVDGRADIYALGIITYEVLAGRRPFPQEQPLALVMAHMMHEPPNILHACPALSKSVARAIRQAMSKDPTARYSSASAFVEALGYREEQSPKEAQP